MKIIDELKYLRVSLRNTKGRCKSNRVKRELGEQMAKIENLIGQLERETSANDV